VVVGTDRAGRLVRRERCGRAADRPLAEEDDVRLAYADPPYPGQAHQYRDHPDYAGEVDHAALIEQLCGDYPDGWALSTNAVSLQYVLGLCPADVRIAAWHVTNQPHPGGRAGWWPVWEPVIVRGGRPGPVRNVLECGYGGGAGRFIGAKPPAFTRWMLELLGAEIDDTIDDLFPGSGAVSLAIEAWRKQPKIPVWRPRAHNRPARERARDMRLSGQPTLAGLEHGPNR
jgi:hypothetical protein